MICQNYVNQTTDCNK